MRIPARPAQLARGLLLLAGFVLLAAATMWPLPAHLQTHLLGDPTGDTGVYVWNLWIFRHELIRHGHLPFSTDHVFSYTGGADFSLHNYAPIAGLLGAPLIGLVGLVGTFNLLMILLVACSGCAVYALARRLGLGPTAAWAGGAVFLACPVLTARETAHFSLVIAAPLPLFLWALFRTLDSRRVRDAILVGTLCGVASYCDAYYGIYCLLMGLLVVGWRFLRVDVHRNPLRLQGWKRTVEGLLVFAAVAAVGPMAAGIDHATIAGVRIGLEAPYTPMLATLVLGVARAYLEWRPAVRLYDPSGFLAPLVRLSGISIAACLVVLSPVLVGIGLRYVNGRLPGTEIYWRSSPRGVDLLAYLVPNPNHPLLKSVSGSWFLPDKQDAFPEFVGSFSVVALAVIGFAAWRRRLPALWIAFTLFFALLSLGPFVYVAGMNTYFPGPWAFLRYVPVVGMARAPSRFAIVAALGLSVLFAYAVQAWMDGRRSSGWRWAQAAMVGAALAAELFAIPRPLYSAVVPEVYRLIATTSDESGRLLELPTGVRDGTSSLGDFNASSQYFQTSHRRRLIGGYLSRVSRWRQTESLREPVLAALFALGEGRDVSPALQREAANSRQAFLARSCVRYVVVNKRRATPSMRNFAVETLRLLSVHSDEDYELLTPIDPPACDPDRPSPADASALR
jgi:hypothetical protein